MREELAAKARDADRIMDTARLALDHKVIIKKSKIMVMPSIIHPAIAYTWVSTLLESERTLRFTAVRLTGMPATWPNVDEACCKSDCVMTPPLTKSSNEINPEPATTPRSEPQLLMCFKGVSLFQRMTKIGSSSHPIFFPKKKRE